ncbi:MAG: peptide chain release factor 1 [Candidatus Theseobacter exili]|nr:peptide chain release factor 1 [Candidatus Theseobacter exili]
MFEKLDKLSERLNELEKLLSDPDILSNRSLYQQYAKEHSDVSEVLCLYVKYKKILGEIEETQVMLHDNTEEEMIEFLGKELAELINNKENLENEIRSILAPRDKNDDRNIIMEIRAGTGGEEAALFSSELYRMYTHYAESVGWKTENLSSNPTGTGGLKEVIFSVLGKDVYRKLRHESGTHRVQRVPQTESSGRIHTSAVTVAVLPEAKEVEVSIDPKELRIDVFRSSGPGGQHVNTTDSAVRITHLPTGIVVSCQDEKSQHKNKAKAMRVLRARVKEKMEREAASQIAQNRKVQVGSGDRSEKIRTYNYPQNRVTDHRINLTLYKLQEILEGNLNDFITALMAAWADKMSKL